MSITFSRRPAKTRQDLKREARVSADPVQPGPEQTPDKLRCKCEDPGFECSHQQGCVLGQPYVATGTYKPCGWCGSPAVRYERYKTKEAVQCSRGECVMSRLIFDVSEWENRGGTP